MGHFVPQFCSLNCKRPVVRWPVDCGAILWQWRDYSYRTMPRDHLEFYIKTVKDNLMEDFPHHQNDISLSSKLKWHHFELGESSPIVKMSLSTDYTSECFLDPLYQHSAVFQSPRFQSGQQYSIRILTNDLYRVTITSLSQALNTLNTHESVLLALETILPICLDQLKSADTITPRSLTSSTGYSRSSRETL